MGDYDYYFMPNPDLKVRIMTSDRRKWEHVPNMKKACL